MFSPRNFASPTVSFSPVLVRASSPNLMPEYTFQAHPAGPAFATTGQRYNFGNLHAMPFGGGTTEDFRRKPQDTIGKVVDPLPCASLRNRLSPERYRIYEANRDSLHFRSMKIVDKVPMLFANLIQRLQAKCQLGKQPNSSWRVMM